MSRSRMTSMPLAPLTRRNPNIAQSAALSDIGIDAGQSLVPGRGPGLAERRARLRMGRNRLAAPDGPRQPP